jgi:hypothetical protein
MVIDPHETRGRLAESSETCSVCLLGSLARRRFHGCPERGLRDISLLFSRHLRRWLTPNRNRNAFAVQTLLSHTKIESTVYTWTPT